MAPISSPFSSPFVTRLLALSLSPVKVKLAVFSLHIFPADILMPVYFIKYIECSEQTPPYQVFFINIPMITHREPITTLGKFI
jgi:hypothetical protein